MAREEDPGKGSGRLHHRQPSVPPCRCLPRQETGRSPGVPRPLPPSTPTPSGRGRRRTQRALLLLGCWSPPCCSQGPPTRTTPGQERGCGGRVRAVWAPVSLCRQVISLSVQLMALSTTASVCAHFLCSWRLEKLDFEPFSADFRQKSALRGCFRGFAEDRAVGNRRNSDFPEVKHTGGLQDFLNVKHTFNGTCKHSHGCYL